MRSTLLVLAWIPLAFGCSTSTNGNGEAGDVSDVARSDVLPGDVAGIVDCSSLYACTSACATGDQACLDACAAAAPSAVIVAYNDLADCSNLNRCADLACVTANCPTQLAACTGGGGGDSFTTSGSCTITYSPPGIAPQTWCWDYSLTASGNTNNGSEHHVYYDALLATDGQTTCADANGQESTGPAGGALDASALSASNLAHKKQACTLQGQSLYTSATWGDPPCTTTGSLGHCTWAVTNTYDPSSGNVTSHTDTVWTVP